MSALVLRRAAAAGAVALLAVALATPQAPASAAAAAGPYGRSVTGTVFFPNPVQQTGNQALTDRHDSDGPAFASSYRAVTLQHLDASGSLTGRWVRVKSETGAPVQVAGGALPAYHRDADQFEQVMGYYWVDTAQAYLQSLGFGSELRPVNQRQIELRINQYGSDNSFFRPTRPTSRSAREASTTRRTPR